MNASTNTAPISPTAADPLFTPEFRVSFPNVFRPQKSMEAGKDPKYGITMLFAKGADLSKLKKAAADCAREFFGARLDNPVFAKKLRSPFRDQGEKDFSGYEAGAIFINATSKIKPGLVDAQVQTIIDESQFYAGCYARATVRAFAYDQAGNVGVAFGLNNIQKLREGEPLGGRARPEDEFEAAPAALAGATTGGDGSNLFG